MVDIYYIRGNPEEVFHNLESKQFKPELHPVTGKTISSEKVKVDLAPIIQTEGKHRLKGTYTLRDEKGFYDGNTGFTDRLAIQFARKLGELYGVKQVIIHATFAVGTQSYDFEYGFEMREEMH